MERLIFADEKLAEIGFLDFDIDLELGEKNDFVLYIPYPEWDGTLQPGMYVYVPGTEYGSALSVRRQVLTTLLYPGTLMPVFGQ